MAKFNAFGKEKGWIELICGPMFAGKSEELLRRLKRQCQNLCGKLFQIHM